METQGQRLKHFRKLRGLSQIELARISGVGQSAISELENDKPKDIFGLIEIAVALRVNVYFLKYGVGSPTGKEVPPELYTSPLKTHEPGPAAPYTSWPFRGITPSQWGSLDPLEREHVEMSARIFLRRQHTP